MTDNIFTLVQPEKEETKGYIKITDSLEKEAIYQADSFGAYEAIPGMIVVWRDDPEEVVGFFNSAFIKSIEIVKESDFDINLIKIEPIKEI